ncbi:hypothetical protein LTR53_020587, partial [Teratosphaeriaceae sp. CCFEE 6253]
RRVEEGGRARARGGRDHLPPAVGAGPRCQPGREEGGGHGGPGLGERRPHGGRQSRAARPDRGGDPAVHPGLRHGGHER